MLVVWHRDTLVFLLAPQRKASQKNWCKLHITETHIEYLGAEPPTSTEDPHLDSLKEGTWLHSFAFIVTQKNLKSKEEKEV